jgi:HAD superfamily hydrolase (TIGR01549 family)
MSLSDLLEFPKDLRVIVFDFDGTIVKLHVDWDDLRAYLSEKYMDDFGEEESFERLSIGLKKVVDRGESELIESYIRAIERFERENVKDSTFFEEIVYFIEHLEEFGLDLDTKLAIFSLNFRSTIFSVLSQRNLLGKFHFIVGREDVVEWKPDPEGLFKILKKFNVSSEQAIYIGDSKYDFEAGENAKIKTYSIETLIDALKKVKET